MSAIKKPIPSTDVDKNTHLGYNEKNPAQPQGSFKADSMETKPAAAKKGIPSSIRKKKKLI